MANNKNILTCEFNITATDKGLLLNSPNFENMSIYLETDELEAILSVLKPALAMYYVLAGCPQPSNVLLTEKQTKPAGVYKSFKARIMAPPQS